MATRAYVGLMEPPYMDAAGVYANYWTRMEGVPDSGGGVTVPYGSSRADLEAAIKVDAKTVLDPFLQDPLSVTEIEWL